MTQKVGVGKNDLVLTERVRVGVHNNRILISRVRSNFGHCRSFIFRPFSARSLSISPRFPQHVIKTSSSVGRSVGRPNSRRLREGWPGENWDRLLRMSHFVRSAVAPSTRSLASPSRHSPSLSNDRPRRRTRKWPKTPCKTTTGDPTSSGQLLNLDLFEWKDSKSSFFDNPTKEIINFFFLWLAC